MSCSPYGRIRVGRWFIPSLRDLGPLLLAWGMALLVLGYEKDIGTSLLFFGVFAAMLYIATRRGAYLVGTFMLLAIGAVFALQRVRARALARRQLAQSVDRRRRTTASRSSKSWYAFGSGGISGTGLGLGNPELIPNAATDFVFSAIGEELGLVGTIGVLVAFMLLIGSAYRIAVDATRPFAKLFAAGIATILGFQTFLIIGGVTRVIPLTGITLPFVSYGGSSLVANFALLAILLRISDDTARERAAPVAAAMNIGIRRVGTAMIDPVPRARRAAHLSPGRAQQPARQRSARTSRNSCATSSATAGRSSRRTASSLAKSVPVNDEFKYQRVYPRHGRSCSRTSSATNRSSSGRPASKPTYSSDLAGRSLGSLPHQLAQGLSARKADRARLCSH